MGSLNDQNFKILMQSTLEIPSKDFRELILQASDNDLLTIVRKTPPDHSQNQHLLQIEENKDDFKEPVTYLA